MISAALLCLAQLTTRIAGVQRATLPATNVLVIVGDDLGWSERSYMPALDTLAAQGMTFSRAYSWPVCSPTRYAALAGRYPRRAGIGDVVSAHNSANGASPAPDRLDVLLPEALKPSMATALFGKWHLGRATTGSRVDLLDVTEGGPFVSGFDVWRAGNPNSIAQGPGATGYFDWYRVDDGTVSVNAGTYATAAQRDAFLSWWGATSGPKFAWLAFNAAHAPYDTPPGYTPHPTTRGQYLQVVDYLDGALDAVLAGVDLNDTIIVYFGDNGTPDDARPTGSPSGYWKGSTYEGGVKVPLIVAGPGVSAGSSSRLVSLVDLPATIMEVFGVTSRGFEDSQSFANALGIWTGTTARSWVFTERYGVPVCQAGPLDPPCPQPEAYDDTAVIEANWKLRVVDADGIGPGGKAELVYYLPSDPYELAPSPGWTTSDGTPPPSGLTSAQLTALSIATTRLRAELAKVPARLP